MLAGTGGAGAGAKGPGKSPVAKTTLCLARCALEDGEVGSLVDMPHIDPVWLQARCDGQNFCGDRVLGIRRALLLWYEPRGNSVLMNT